MSIERIVVWASALAACAVLVAGYLAPPTPTAQLVVAVLGIAVGLPLAIVFVGWAGGVVASR